jgi:hypothetical protein
MSLTITVQNVDATGTLTSITGGVTFSGNYATGGDTLDWTTVVEQVGQSGQIAAFATPPVQVKFESQNGNAGYYVPVLGNALNNWKLKCFLGSGTEVGAGAYPSSVTSDVVVFQAYFLRLK